jgi:poly(A) polymerase
LALRGGPVPQPDCDDAELRRLLANEDHAVLIDRTWLSGGNAPRWAKLRQRLAALPRPVFPVEGRDVLALGEPEGPRVGALLREVRRWWLDNGCTASRAECLVELVQRRSRG